MSSILRTSTPLALGRSLSTSAAVRYASKPSTSTTKSSDSSEQTPPRPQHDTAETAPTGKNSLPGSGSSNPQDRVPGEQNKTGGKGDQTESASEGKETVKGPLGDAKSPKGN